MTNFNYFTLAPLIDESTQQYKFEGGIEASGSSLPAVNLEYRFVYDSENEDNEASPWQMYSVGDTITQQEIRWFGVQFRNDSGSFSTDFSNYYHVKSTYAFDAGGKIISLINYTDESAALPDYAFRNLFTGTKIHDAHELILPDRVSENCYSNTFTNCSSLTTAPALPATTLAPRCYINMFQKCTSLTTAPGLPATTLTTSCYYNMFENCKSLTTAPALPATTLAPSCYANMFSSCSSLTTTPELPATTLANDCYNSMFDGCTKIDRIVWKSTTIPSSKYCGNWLNRVYQSGTFEYTDPTLNVASIKRDINGVPAWWSISLLSQETKLLLKINNASVDNISLLGKKIASLSINGKQVKSSSAA